MTPQLDRAADWERLRFAHPVFTYRSSSYRFEDGKLLLKYVFEQPGVAVFKPTWEIPLPEGAVPEGSPLLDELVFLLGMTEAVSYWKAAASPTLHVEAGNLTPEQAEWFKKLYYNGLGEYFYLNGIRTNLDEFVKITASSPAASEVTATAKAGVAGVPDSAQHREPTSMIASVSGGSPSQGTKSGGRRNLIPVGGGKDSIVSLNLLTGEKERNVPFIINPRGATLDTVKTAGYELEKCALVTRRLDPRLIELNAEGYLNGHTPFSAIVAFSSLIIAHLWDTKYVVLSNESSANEATAISQSGEDVNHQYSKGIGFENDFRAFVADNLPELNVEYFSFLRPLSELKIAEIFSRCPDFFPVFKSCNAGSKTNSWCCNCPKCLFVYIILSPFLPPAQLEAIFGENLLVKPSLQEELQKLRGILPDKPFECVGSRDEVNAALAVSGAQKGDHSVKREQEEFDALLNFYDPVNNLPPHFDELLRGAVKVQ
jgi:hypothetical protein